MEPAPRVGHRPTLAIALALAAVATNALGEIADIAWDASGKYERTLSVAPGKFAEVCGKLPAGLKVRWAFEADASLDFNVHYHVGKEVVLPTKLAAVATGKDTLSTNGCGVTSRPRRPRSR